MASDPAGLLSQLLGTTGQGYNGMQQVQQDRQQSIGNQQALQLQQAKLNSIEQAAAQEKSYQDDVASYFADPRPERLSQLSLRYPEQAQAFQNTYKMMGDAQKQSAVTQFGGIYNAAKNGRSDLVSKLIGNVITAEKAQGIDTAEAEDLKAQLDGGDPKALTTALAFSQMHLSAADPSVAKALGIGAESDEFSNTPQGDIYSKKTGEVSHAAPPKPVVDRADVFDASGNKVGTRTVYNGQPVSGGQIEQLALNAVPGATVTSRSRTAEHNAEVGGVPNSYHLTDEARDLVPPQGMKMGAFAAVLKQSLPGMKVLDEGTHVHIQPIARNSASPFMAKPKTAAASGSTGGAGGLSAAAIELAAKQGLARGGLIPTGFSRNKEAVTAIQNRMADLASGKDVSSIIQGGQDVKAQQAAVIDFGKGKLGANVRSLNVAVDHLDQLKMAAAALQNGNIQLFNKIGNGYAQQTGSSRPTDFNAVKGFVMDEAVKAIVGAGGGVGDREEAKNLVSSSNSPEQLQGAVARIQGLMGGQLNGLALQYKNSTGRDDFQKRLSPRTIQAIGHHLDGKEPAPPAASGPPPGAKQIGTYQGKAVFQLPNGKRVVQQ